MTALERQRTLEQARQGAGDALGRLLDDLRPYVRFLARALRAGRAPARLDDSDLVQDAMLEAHRSFAGFEGATVADLLAWLRPIVIRTGQRSLRFHLGTGKREAGRERPVENLDGLAGRGSHSPTTLAIRHEQTAQLAAAVNRLPDDVQQVILGRHVDGLSHAELAQQLQRSEEAIRAVYSRGLRKLRELLNEE